MNPSIQRAHILQEQGRYADATAQWRQVLASDPNDAHAHAMLSLCLLEQQDAQAATQEAEQAVGLAPDEAFMHYVLARVLAERDRHDQALAAIQQAIEIDSYDAAYFSLLAAIRFEQRNWPAALEAAEQGLAIDPEDPGCVNLRAMALTKLGRRDEAAQTIGDALARDPESALTHANQGWTLLHAGDVRKAQEHFREALRIDPGMEWARAGIVEAMKAKNFIYRWLLMYFLWMARLSSGAQWGIIIGGYLSYRALRAVAANNPDLAPFVFPLLAAYLLFALLTWLAQPFFNLLLRLDRFGRMALSREQVVHSNWLAALIGLALAFLAGALLTEPRPMIIGAICSAALMLPLTATFNCSRGWPRWTMLGVTLAMALAAAGAVAVDWSFGADRSAAPLGLFAMGMLFTMWGGQALAAVQPRQ